MIIILLIDFFLSMDFLTDIFTHIFYFRFCPDFFFNAVNFGNHWNIHLPKLIQINEIRFSTNFDKKWIEH